MSDDTKFWLAFFSTTCIALGIALYCKEQDIRALRDDKELLQSELNERNAIIDYRNNLYCKQHGG